MIITIKTAVTFELPKDKELIEQCGHDNPDWVMDTPTTNTVTYRRTQIFGIGGDTK